MKFIVFVCKPITTLTDEFLLSLKIQTTKDKLEEMEKEQGSLIDIFSEDRDRRDKEEENLRNKLEVLIRSNHISLNIHSESRNGMS